MQLQGGWRQKGSSQCAGQSSRNDRNSRMVLSINPPFVHCSLRITTYCTLSPTPSNSLPSRTSSQSYSCNSRCLEGYSITSDSVHSINSALSGSSYCKYCSHFQMCPSSYIIHLFLQIPMFLPLALYLCNKCNTIAGIL